MATIVIATRANERIFVVFSLCWQVLILSAVIGDGSGVDRLVSPILHFAQDDLLRDSRSQVISFTSPVPHPASSTPPGPARRSIRPACRLHPPPAAHRSG